MRFGWKIVGVLVAFGLVYGWGAMSVSYRLFPYSWAASVRHAMSERANPAGPTRPGRFDFDQAGRLAADLEKQALPCPAQSDRTLVLLIAGQSNAANHGGQRMESEHGTAIVNFFAGSCYRAA